MRASRAGLAFVSALAAALALSLSAPAAAGPGHDHSEGGDHHGHGHQKHEIGCVDGHAYVLDEPYQPGALLLRFHLGPGYLWGKGQNETSLQSAAGGVGLVMGGFVLPNFAVHGDFGWVNGFDPDFFVNGTIDHTTNLLFQTMTGRIGVSYYLMPAQLYFSAGIGIGSALLSSYRGVSSGSSAVGIAGTSYTKIGPSFGLQVGKEWPVSQFWGMGVAIDYQYLHAEPQDDSLNYIVIENSQQLGVRFVATFGSR